MIRITEGQFAAALAILGTAAWIAAELIMAGM